ncbi:MAG TPA: type II toxin-antitoxin system HipA family toxin [Kiritimatiellia bacterium]|nr:type II toxin-antitoxin system HipA family toxin [Kiritimatiellia bacterium]HMO99103.1 type II toxin-antitoxin system HipA family toxin [Kiritimatiellia bacterium]HMP96937.1 type II toxin-antitoxin system HipA family toxin [Kiritimatiellia bacterium]
MSDRLHVFVGGTRAGVLERRTDGYRFAYVPGYAGPPAFLNLPVKLGEKVWDDFPPPFDGLLPEGVLLEQLLTAAKLDRQDKWGQLLAVGRDVTGMLTILPEGQDNGASLVRLARSGKKRARIKPGDEALPYEVGALITFHSREAPRMSISGVQPKVSAIFSRRDGCFRAMAEGGTYILKPSPTAYPEAASNEALSMELARLAGVEVPACGLVWSRDQRPVFWIERFDRQGTGGRIRLRVEDACQLLEIPSSWKYHGTVETLTDLLRRFTSNPALQLARFFDRFLFNWIIGNGDMHLKNWSLIERGPLIELAPAYDYLNTAILIDNEEESALAFGGMKQGFDPSLLVERIGRELCALPPLRIRRTLERLHRVDWSATISGSALSPDAKARYHALVNDRLAALTGERGG